MKVKLTAKCDIVPRNELPEVVYKGRLKRGSDVHETSPGREKHEISVPSRSAVEERISGVEGSALAGIVRRIESVELFQDVGGD